MSARKRKPLPVGAGAFGDASAWEAIRSNDATGERGRGLALALACILGAACEVAGLLAASTDDPSGGMVAASDAIDAALDAVARTARTG